MRFLSILLFLTFPLSSFAQRDNIERIEIVGNQIIVTETYFKTIDTQAEFVRAASDSAPKAA